MPADRAFTYATPGSADATAWLQSQATLPSNVGSWQVVWDGAKAVGVTKRIDRVVARVDVTDETKSACVRSEQVDSFPERAIFFNGKLVVPCGYQGVLKVK